MGVVSCPCHLKGLHDTGLRGPHPDFVATPNAGAGAGPGGRMSLEEKRGMDKMSCLNVAQKECGKFMYI